MVEFTQDLATEQFIHCTAWTGCTGEAPQPAPDEDKNCEDFPSQAAAQRELERDPTDPNNLDADDDGQACEDFNYAGGTSDDGPDDHQYNADDREVTVIIETIPDQKRLADTGGPSAATTVGMFLAVGLIGAGIALLRKTWWP